MRSAQKQDIYSEASAIWEQQKSSDAMGARNSYADEMGAGRFRYSVSGGRAGISAIGVMGIVAGRRDLERSDRCCLDRDDGYQHRDSGGDVAARKAIG